jgi:hypothetical protein
LGEGVLKQIATCVLAVNNSRGMDNTCAKFRRLDSEQMIETVRMLQSRSGLEAPFSATIY